MNKIMMQLDFSGVVLPVIEDEQGQQVVPLKPISDIFGLNWSDQHKRMQTPYLAQRLGVCIGELPYAGQRRKMVCIRLDRVSAYLYTLNPDQIRVGGNAKGADFLEAKHEAWDDLLHDYEVASGILSKNESLKSESVRLRKISSFLSICREKRVTQSIADRLTLSDLAQQLAAEVGVPYQMDFEETDVVVGLLQDADQIQDAELRGMAIEFINKVKKTA